MSYQEWLEKPYDELDAERAEYEEFCERYGLDPMSQDAMNEWDSREPEVYNPWDSFDTNEEYEAYQAEFERDW